MNSKIRGIALGLLTTLLMVSVAKAQVVNKDNNVLKGIVQSDGKAIPNATIRLKSLNRTTTSDSKGQFLFDMLPAGAFELEVNTVNGLQKQKVKILYGDTTNIVLAIDVASQSLDNVTISTGYNKFNKKETDDVARLPLKNMENPQVYSIVTKEILAEQVVTDYNSIFKNIPGAGVPVVYNQGRSMMLSRGFLTGNFIRNSISGFVYTNIDPANLEVLEAVKGPTGTLFNSAQTSFGGLFNRVTKKPFDGDRNEISYFGGGNNLNRLTFDINHPLTEDHNVLFRLNGALHTEQSFQDQGFTKSAMFAPSFIFKYSDRLNFVLDIEASSYNGTSQIRFAPSTSWTVHNIKDLGIGYRRSFGSNSLDYVTQQLNVYGQVNYKINEQWKLQTNITRTYSATKGYVTMLTGIGSHNDSLQQTAQKENFPYNGTEIQQNLVGDFYLGKLRNRLVVGLDYYNQRSDRNTPTITMPAINFLKPGDKYLRFNADVVDSMAPYAKKKDVYRTNQYNYSAYFSDVLNITDRWNVMVSLRLDNMNDKGTYYPAVDTSAGAFNQTSLSPKFGMVYELIKETVSLFGNYMNGMNYTGGTDYNGKTFKPQRANQWEFGVKADAFNHRLSATVSYYNISVTNMLVDDITHNGYSVQDGTQLSKGMEAEVIANPFEGFNVVAGYSYNDSKLTKANPSTNGLRPASAGPANLANLWMSYRLLRGPLRGLGIGIGGNHGSESFQTNTASFVFKIPSYTVLDGTLFYDIHKYRIGLKVDNITNEQYWSYRLAPQLPRRITASVGLRF